ncbi:RHTO0S03e04896g1_1 [Rhodotorula toruloides]|uniref:RHTO0S03e04896g1_1 n=2 Tax=Rhodotorula toruloides TaxID=5286 RepID=A0A061AKR1_RHOTO|nr:L-lactate dehydrogenase (cytochrome) [Rhodotorula toruloides NP11]EMS25823.1 L-lactate dehydrogenase (cytochrome) [Rhodotorula toruloides NP11]KAJ8295991.1 (S)-mandelate dehydrogenase, mitochondrial [Rhodotorula toruloides]CDR38165.1 RHTO0S03e04896g1_1 [Rhodotorula toruloides]
MAFARARTVARNLHQSLNRRPFSTASPSQGAAARAASKRAFQLGIGAGAVLTVGGVATYLYTQSPVFLDAPSPLPVKQRRRDRSLTAAEVAKHNSKGDLWVVIDSQVWDISDFAEIHPGGIKVLEQNAGKDVTKLFKTIHPPKTLEKFLTDENLVGYIDVDESTKIGGGKNAEDFRIEQARKSLRNVDTIVCLDEFEEIAQSILTEMAASYYATGSETEQSLRDERESWQRIRFRPRVMRKMRHIDSRTSFLGMPQPLPFFIAPAGLARLGHPDGELNITRGAAEHGVVQIVSSGASASIDEIFGAKQREQILFWQLYLPGDREAGAKKIKHAVELGAKAIFVTADVPVLGKRERDLKLKARSQSYEHPIAAQWKAAGASDWEAVKQPGVSDIPDTAHIDANLCWEDIPWIRKQAPGIPIVVKGVGCVEDVEEAKRYGADGVVLSTHGGRQLDGARAPIDVLIEIRKKNPELLKEIEVYIDGGARRGTDVVKALCLGAKGVGFGRSFLYAQSAFGAAGVSKAIKILEEEVHSTMRLLGANTIADLKPEMVEVSSPERWVPV